MYILATPSNSRLRHETKAITLITFRCKNEVQTREHIPIEEINNFPEKIISWKTTFFHTPPPTQTAGLKVQD